MGKPARQAGSAVRVTFDVGALFEGDPNVTVTHSSTLLNAQQGATLDGDIQSSIKNTLDDLKVYPVVSLGLAFHI